MNKVKTIIKPRTLNYIPAKSRKATTNNKKIRITSANRKIYKEICR